MDDAFQRGGNGHKACGEYAGSKIQGKKSVRRVRGRPYVYHEKRFSGEQIFYCFGDAVCCICGARLLWHGKYDTIQFIAAAIKVTFGIHEAKTGLVIGILTILAVLGGIRTISRVTQVLVPVMGVFYMAGALAVILFHAGNVPGGIVGILQGAFCPEAVGGGLFGSVTVSVMEAFRWGISRGVFSNEAGLGAAGISAAAADTKDYIKQGYISMTGVFWTPL